MKVSRLIYIVILLTALTLAASLHYQYQLKDRELFQYQNLTELSSATLGRVNAQLLQNRQELAKSLQEIEGLNQAIASLEKEKTDFKEQLQALSAEREKLMLRVSTLLEEKSALEKEFGFIKDEFAALEKKFHSVEELKKAIKVAIGQRSQKRRLAKIEMLNTLDKIALREGNQGYFVKGGKSTFRAVKIRVELEPSEKVTTK